jgi:hypothetical protein
MISKANTKELLAVCQQLADEGVTPSVALLRSRAPFRVSVIEAIDAMRKFNQIPQKIEIPKKPASEAAQISALEKRVTELENAIHVLETRLNALS